MIKKYMWGLLGVLVVTGVQAKSESTKRVEQFSNNEVKVWRTTVYPSANKALAMHRHEHNRVVVALTDGVLKITNDKGKTHYFKLEKDKAYYLSKDAPNEMHNDVNVGKHPVKVMVIELADRGAN